MPLKTRRLLPVPANPVPASLVPASLVLTGLVLALSLLLDSPAALAQGQAIPPQQRVTNAIEREVAVLRWLDKLTARVQTVNVPVNQTVRIQTLEIIVRTCVERPPEEPPESAVFLDVWERRPGAPVTEVYRGWMFASSPALSAMEHPVYDLWVLDCTDAAEIQDEDSDSGSSTPDSDSGPS